VAAPCRVWAVGARAVLRRYPRWRIPPRPTRLLTRPTVTERRTLDNGFLRRAARSPAYVRLLLLAAVLGVPVSAAAYLFLYLVGLVQLGCSPTCLAGLVCRTELFPLGLSQPR
jgi:hypothetical protein